MFDCIFAPEIVPISQISQLNIYFMKVSFDQLKYLVTVVADDLLNDDFGNFQQDSDVSNGAPLSDVSEEMYNKVLVLKDLLLELYEYRPLPF